MSSRRKAARRRSLSPPVAPHRGTARYRSPVEDPTNINVAATPANLVLVDDDDVDDVGEHKPDVEVEGPSEELEQAAINRLEEELAELEQAASNRRREEGEKIAQLERNLQIARLQAKASEARDQAAITELRAEIEIGTLMLEGD